MKKMTLLMLGIIWFAMPITALKIEPTALEVRHHLQKSVPELIMHTLEAAQKNKEKEKKEMENFHHYHSLHEILREKTKMGR